MGPLPSHHPQPLLSWSNSSLLSSSTPQDSVPLGEGPTLSLNFVTFDSAGTYICEASMPTVPLLSRTQALKLLVEGLGVGAGWDGDMGTMGMRGQDQWDRSMAGPSVSGSIPLPSLLSRSLLSPVCLLLTPFPPTTHRVTRVKARGDSAQGRGQLERRR